MMQPGLWVLVTALLLGARRGAGAVRYAAPGGTGPPATCPEADPCEIDVSAAIAVHGAVVSDLEIDHSGSQSAVGVTSGTVERVIAKSASDDFAFT